MERLHLFDRQKTLLVVPLLLVVVVGLLGPAAFVMFAAAQVVSVHTIQGDTVLLFAGGRGRVVADCLLTAGIALGAGLVFALPFVLVPSAAGSRRLIRVASAACLAGLLFNPALRLFSLRALIGAIGAQEGGHWANYFLFSRPGTIVGLVWSYIPFLILPLAQAATSGVGAVVPTGIDAGMSLTRRALCLLRVCAGSVVSGSLLFFVMAWFSALEYRILGTKLAVEDVLQSLVSVERYDSVYLYGALLTAVAAGSVWCVVGAGGLADRLLEA